MIVPKTAKPTAADERRAYDAATERDAAGCVRCGRGGVLQRDHRQNRQSGNTVAENLQCLCPDCHQWKTEHPKLANAAGYGVGRFDDFLTWPARRWVTDTYGRRSSEWVLYVGTHWEIITADYAALLREGTS